MTCDTLYVYLLELVYPQKLKSNVTDVDIAINLTECATVCCT